MKVAAPVAARMILMLAGVGVIFAVAQVPFRHLEALVVAGGAALVPVGKIVAVHGSAILLQSSRGSFWVDITPSCSSLGPALALGAFGAVLSSRAPRRRRTAALAAGVGAIVAGNLIRMGSSVVVGLLAGRISLVLFHDWVGSIFGFGYALGGFVLVLRLLLPAGSRLGTLPPRLP